MSALRRVLPLVGLLVVVAAAVGVLHALGDQPWARVSTDEPGRWMVATPPVEALMAVLRLVGLAMGWWLLATTTVVTVAAWARAERVNRWVRPLTWAPARRVADRAVAAGVSAVLVASGVPSWAGEASPPPPPLGEPAAVDPTPSGEDGRHEPAGVRNAEDSDDTGDGHDAEGATRTHEVAAGENLWAIAAEDLAARRGIPAPQVDEGAVAAHWHAVIEANADRLRSGEPDLVFPGERLRLPAPPG